MSDSWYYNFVNQDSALKQSLIKHGASFNNFRYLHSLVNTAIGQFSYSDNISKIQGLTPQIQEMALMFRNHLCYYNAETIGGWILCQYIDGADYDFYWKPKRVNLIALNGAPIASDVPYDDIILLRDNIMDLIPYLYVDNYINIIGKLEKNMMKVLRNGTLPIIMIGDKKLANQLRLIARKTDDEEPYILSDDVSLKDVQAFNIETPIQPKDVYELKTNYFNECLTQLGIYANTNRKRERLLQAEVQTQNDFTDFIYQEKVNERQRALDELYKRSGIKIELIETYETNKSDESKEKADSIYDVTKAQAQAIKDVAPEALQGGINSGVPKPTIKKNE